MFGERALNVANVNAPRRTTGGLRQFITTNVTDLGGAPLTVPIMEAFIRSGFRYNSQGGKRGSKIFVCSRLILSAFAEFSRGQLLTNPKSETYGVKIYTYESANGTIQIVPHELLEGDTYSGWGILLDMPFVKSRYLNGGKTKLRRNIHAPDYDGFTHEYIEECGLQVELEDTHAILEGVNGF